MDCLVLGLFVGCLDCSCNFCCLHSAGTPESDGKRLLWYVCVPHSLKCKNTDCLAVADSFSDRIRRLETRPV